MKIQARVTLTVKDPRTARILARRSFVSRSYVIGFLDGLAIHMRDTTANVKDTGGTIRAITPYTYMNDCTIGVNDDTHGIVVGTGTTAVAISDFQLETQIAHGIGAGQLSHGASGNTAPVTIGTKRRFLLTRSFTNQSGGSITVNECGIYVRCGVAPWYYFLDVRDIISGGQAVPDTKTLTIQYEIYVTV